MQKLHLIIGLLLLVNTVKAQSVNTYTTNASPVNKLCPNFLFDTLINYKKEKVALADWKGRYVILDFWSTSCLPCIAEFPKLENFQKRFGDSLQILLAAVGFERTSRFYETRKKINKPVELPCAINPTAFDYFKVKVVSTFVWIDDQGYVKAITDDSQITESNIAAFINKKDLHLREMETPTYADYKNKKYLVTIANEIDTNSVVFNSSLTKCLKSVKGGYLPPRKGVGTTVHATNSMIGALYMIAFGDSTGAVPYSRLVIESAHPEKYIAPKGTDYEEWRNDNTFCYELTVPKDRARDLLKIMQDDLKRMFGANAYMEERTQKCLVLTAEKVTHMQADRSATPKKVYNTGGCSVINQPFADLFEMIHHYNQDKILLDETGITDNVTVALQAQMNDIDALNESLKQYGLNLAYKDRPVKMLVIRDPVK
jgi:thiol-disulfide isomerase/thioredoxin